MIELVLLVPFMVIIAVCGVEFTRCLRHRKMAQALSKEIANTVFRECASLRTLQMSSCIQDARGLVQEMAVRIAPGSHVAVTAYVHSVMPGAAIPGLGTVFEAHAPDPLHRAGLPNNCRRGILCANMPGALVNPSSWSLLRSHGVVVVGEAFVQYRPLMGPIASLFGYAARNDSNNPSQTGFFMDAIIL